MQRTIETARAWDVSSFSTLNAEQYRKGAWSPDWEKIGPQAANAPDPRGAFVADRIARTSRDFGRRLFIDFKLRDAGLPELKALKSRFPGIKMLTVSWDIPSRQMRDTVAFCGDNDILCVAATLHTRVSKEECELRHKKSPDVYVCDAARFVFDDGAHGITCSGIELPYLAEHNVFAGGKLAVVPGIRFADSPKDEQERICTPADVVRNGPKHLILVVGRIVKVDSDALRLCTEISQARVPRDQLKATQ